MLQGDLLQSLQTRFQYRSRNRVPHGEYIRRNRSDQPENMYKYTDSDIDEELECVPCCRMELDDGTVLQLSDRKFRQVLTCGLESYGYMNGKRIVKYTNNPGQAS